MVSSPSVSNAPTTTILQQQQQQQQNNDDLTIICSLYIFMNRPSIPFLLFSYQKYIFISLRARSLLTTFVKRKTFHQKNVYKRKLSSRFPRLIARLLRFSPENRSNKKCLKSESTLRRRPLDSYEGFTWSITCNFSRRNFFKTFSLG